MYYDLNVSYTTNHAELQRTLTFLTELGYGTIALDYAVKDKLSATVVNAIPEPLPFQSQSSLRILRRCTLDLSDPSQNHRLSSVTSVYDILAIRPTNEKSLQQACNDLQCDLISLDMSVRYPFFFKHTMLSNALKRGVLFEICYGPGIMNLDGNARRNLISNATQLIRGTRGRGIVISSEAKKALACRSPADIINMAVLWGLGQERGREAVYRNARNVVVQAEMKRRSFRGVIDVVHGGERLQKTDKKSQDKQVNGKRKAEAVEDEVADATVATKPISKREQKRQAKKARLENLKTQEAAPKGAASAVSMDAERTTGTTLANGDAG